MEHSKWEDREAGENIAYVWDLYTAGQTATKLWYDEIQHYNFTNPSFDAKTGENGLIYKYIQSTKLFSCSSNIDTKQNNQERQKTTNSVQINKKVCGLVHLS